MYLHMMDGRAVEGFWGGVLRRGLALYTFLGMYLETHCNLALSDRKYYLLTVLVDRARFGVSGLFE